MVRAPYPARIAAGLIVVALEETRRLPTRLFTLPMTAVSQTLQAGMRAQQQIAELAIKGDEALDLIFDKADEQPEWARFDEDELTEIDPGTPIESADKPGAEATTAKVTTLHAAPATVTKPPTTAKSSPDTPATTKSAAKKSAPKKSTPTKATPTKPASKDSTPTPKKSTPTKSTPTKSMPTKSASTDSTPENPAPRADAGRFALYSSAPADLITGETATPGDDLPDVDKPEIVEFIEYDTLTLAQLRAKLRSVDVDDLTALVAYETATKNRAPFVTMLDNRITAQNKRSPSS
ncbi:lipid droplet-associated protein [Gordonia aichiensis]|uniref:lipid droplet-associated protein n=1 Tax=Gordonia aichiensis TaxID=36820 RepID=UPI000590F34D|nr:lipid droplet-associated protein [Gordonia aichiensis]